MEVAFRSNPRAASKNPGNFRPLAGHLGYSFNHGFVILQATALTEIGLGRIDMTNGAYDVLLLRDAQHLFQDIRTFLREKLRLKAVVAQKHPILSHFPSAIVIDNALAGADPI